MIAALPSAPARSDCEPRNPEPLGLFTHPPTTVHKHTGSGLRLVHLAAIAECRSIPYQPVDEPDGEDLTIRNPKE